MLKKISIKVGFAIMFIQLFTFSACKNEVMEWEDTSLRMSIDSDWTNGNTAIDLSALSYTLCLFRAPINDIQDQTFVCIEKKTLTYSAIGKEIIKVSHSDKGRYAYRLFVHATPLKKAETTVGISIGDYFDKLEIGLAEEETGKYVALSKDNYYNYETLNSPDFSGTIKISLTLKRRVGRLVFDIFKSDTEQNPIDISPNCGSILDRVTQIDMLAEGITTSVKPSGNVVTKSKDSSISLSLETELDPSNQHLLISNQNSEYFKELQKENTTGTTVTPKGGVRLYSVYLLSTGNDNDILAANLTFTYLDELAGSTDPSNKKAISLRLPSSSPTSYLRIVENYYTLTNIRLKHDRIIDVNVSNEISIDTGWSEW